MKRFFPPLCIFVLSTMFYFCMAGLLPSGFYSGKSDDVWFESDTPRVYENLISRSSDHHRAKVHPLFSIVGYTPVFIIRKLFFLSAPEAVRVFISVTGALWAVVLFFIARLITQKTLDAVLLTVMAVVSAASVFWHAVPETYSLSSITIMLAFLVVLSAQEKKVPEWVYTAISAATFSITVTNWSAGIIASFLGNNWKKALRITFNAFLLVVGLWLLQKLIFPSAYFFIKDMDETRHFFLKDSGGPWRVLTAILFHTMVMPEILVKEFVGTSFGPLLTVQLSLPGSSGHIGLLATFLWGVLLFSGFWSLIIFKGHFRLRIMITVFLFCQVVLHLIYGEETFLYALNFLPIFVILSAVNLKTKLRKIFIIFICLYILAAGINNFQQFSIAVGFLK